MKKHFAALTISVTKAFWCIPIGFAHECVSVLYLMNSVIPYFLDVDEYPEMTMDPNPTYV